MNFPSLLLLASMTIGAITASFAAPRYPADADRPLSPGHTTYFINPTAGADTHPGTDRQHPWRSFGPLNQLRLSPGDRVEILAPGSFEQTLLLTGAGTAKEPVEVHFAPGRYDLHPEHAYREAYQISNTNALPDEAKAVAFLLRRAKHFRLSGAGATMVHRGKMIEVCIDHSEDITISDLAFDYHRPTVSEYKVAAVGDGHVDLQIHRDSPYSIDDGKITWQGEGWSHQDGLTQQLDLATDEVWRRRDPLKGLKMEEIKPFLVRAHGKTDLKPQRIYQVRKTERDCAGVFTRRSKDITWKNVHFRFLHGMGLVHQFSENLTFDAVTLAPEKASGRTTSAWADGIHISGCKGKVLVKDCFFSGTHDDPINVHGTHLRVVERLPDQQVKVRFMHKQTFGFLAFNPGDDIEFVHTDTLATYGPNTVTEAKMLNPKELLLTLKHPLPAEFRENDAMENITWTPAVEIRGCTMERIPTRGFLLTTRRPVLVEDNTFLATRMSGIRIENGATGWCESGCVRNLTIRNNKFIRCAEPVIHIDPQNTVPNNAVHQNIRIENNEFVLRRKSIIKAKSTKGLHFTGNTIRATEELDDASTILTKDCADVVAKGNNYELRPKP